MNVTSRTDGRVAHVTLDRLEKKNAITAEMYVQLAEALAAADADPQVRAILLSGSRDCFTAGNDLADFLQRPPAGTGSPTWRFFEVLPALAKPVVAAVGGPAIGIGSTLLLHCDLVYASTAARFQLPFVALGIVPEFGSTYLLPLLAGYQRAAELLLLGEPFDAERARAAGFVTAVLPPDQVLDAAWVAAEKLARLPKESVRMTRALLKAGHREAIEKALLTEGGHFRELLGKPAAREALSAFMAKRRPDFTGK